MTYILELRNVCLSSTNDQSLAQNINLRIAKEEIALISGPSGSGKSLLLSCISGSRKNISGDIKLNIKKSELIHIPQLIASNFAFPLSFSEIIGAALHNSKERDWVNEQKLLRPDQLDIMWNKSSVGERKKCLLCRALLQQPKLLMLDEPFFNLDYKNKELVVSSLAQFRKNGGSLLMVSNEIPPELDSLKPFENIYFDRRIGTRKKSKRPVGKANKNA